MVITESQWQYLLKRSHSKLLHLLDESSTFIENEKLKTEMSNIPHQGFYIIVVDSSGNKMFRQGFLAEDLKDVVASCDNVLDNLSQTIKAEKINVSKIKTSQLYLTLITDVTYMPDPVKWDENNDGIYFQWGQDYHGLYLPYEIKQMDVPKIRIMDRLCSWEAGVASSLWRLPEGLCWRLVCQSYPS